MQGEAVISYKDYIFPLSTIRAIFLGVRCNWMFAGNNVGLKSCYDFMITFETMQP